MRNIYYPALLLQEEDGGFTVRFPHFPGCLTQGECLTSAAANAFDALHLHITGMQEDGEPLPNPDSMYKKRESESVILIPVTINK